MCAHGNSQTHAKVAQDQAKATKKVALKTEKDNDAAQKEVQDLQRVMEPKRARTNATTVNAHEGCDEQSSVDMDITDYRRETPHIQKRHSVAFDSREDVPTPQKGQTDPMDHPRLGLVGWIVYWCLGNCSLTVKIIVGLIRNLNLTERVSETLTPMVTNRETETNAKIVMLMRSSSISIITGVRIIEAHVSTIKSSRSPVAILINSSELCEAGFKLKEVFPPVLEAAARVHTRGVTL